MADITKCAAFACPKEHTCAKYAGPGRDAKDYDIFHPDKPWLCFLKRETGTCDHPENTYCHHRHNGMCLADKTEHCERVKNDD